MDVWISTINKTKRPREPPPPRKLNYTENIRAIMVKLLHRTSKEFRNFGRQQSEIMTSYHGLNSSKHPNSYHVKLDFIYVFFYFSNTPR